MCVYVCMYVCMYVCVRINISMTTLTNKNFLKNQKIKWKSFKTPF